MNGARWRGWLIAGAIFLLGVAVGGAGTAWFGIRAFRNAMRAPASVTGPADRAAIRIGADLHKQLQLTPEQAARVQSILDQSAANLKANRAQAVAKAAAELRSAIQRIAAELPPEKRRDFYRVITRRYDRLGLQPSLPDQNP
jgi:uncharacterized membrane protein (DUF4010 family)